MTTAAAGIIGGFPSRGEPHFLSAGTKIFKKFSITDFIFIKSVLYL